MENNLFSLGFHELSGDLSSDDPAIHCALVQAKSLDGRGDLLARLSLYEQRLNRTLTLAKAELKQLQQEGAEASARPHARTVQRRRPAGQLAPSGCANLSA